MLIHRLAVPVAFAGLVASAIQEVPAGAALPLEGKLVYAASARGTLDLWAANAGAPQPIQLTDTPAAQEFDPAWSPDGERVAFASKQDGNGSSDIWVMNADGSGLTQLTQDFEGPIDRQPTWSPSGDRLAWVRIVPTKATAGLWVMNANGTGKQLVLKAKRGRYHASPAWSPDGTAIAFVSNRAGGFPELYTVRPDGRHLTRLTDTGRIEGNPDWSLDGTAIAFDRRAVGGDSRIWVLGPDGESALASGSGNREQPSWAPDGEAIAYVSSPSGGGDKDLGVSPIEGGGTTSLSSTTGAEVTPDWSDGTVLPGPGAVTGGEAVAPTGSVAAAETALHATSANQVGPGLQLRKGRFRRSDFWALTFNPPRPTTLDVALAQDRLPGRETVSSMAGRHDAIAAITGDFTLPEGQPTQPFAEDGDLKRTAFSHSHNFAVSRNEERLTMSHPVETVTVTEADSGDVWSMDRWNDGDPGFGDAAGYSIAGGQLVRPPKHVCSARLLPQGGMRWAPGSQGIVRDHRVDKVVCRAKRLGRGPHGVVLSAQPGSLGALMIASLTPGESVSLRWWFYRWVGVADSLGGWPVLRHDGATEVEVCGLSICHRHPRAGVGITEDGRVLMVVVDGRRQGSRGLTLLQFANLMKRLGAVSALNLDGGGSAEMWVRGQVVNNPSDGHERAICSALLVLPGQDAGESFGSGGDAAFSESGPPRPLDAEEEAAAAQASVLDPASTGGMLDAMARGLFGPSPPLEPQLQRALHRFRAAT